MIRKAIESDSERITRIHLNSWKTTYESFFPEEIFINQEKSFDVRNKNIKEAIIKDDEYHYIVFEENKKILGFACYGKGRGNKYENMGEVYSIYLERENQRKGIGTKLINECFKLLKEDNYTEIIIRCLKGNPSENFYKFIGGKVINFEEGKVGETDIIENVYKFDNL